MDFGDQKLSSAVTNIGSANSGELEVRLDQLDGPVIANFKIPKGTSWKEMKVKLSSFSPGKHNLFFVAKGGPDLELDWINFR